MIYITDLKPEHVGQWVRYRGRMGDPRNVIYMEPEVIEALQLYLRKVANERA